MGDITTRARAEQAADRSLERRRTTYIELAVAAEAAQNGSAVYDEAEKKVTSIRQRAEERAAVILEKARQEEQLIRDEAAREMDARTGMWLDKWKEARAAGWTPRELREAEQKPPTRPSNRKPARAPKSAEDKAPHAMAGFGVIPESDGSGRTGDARVSGPRGETDVAAEG